MSNPIHEIETPQLKKGNVYLATITHSGQIDQRMAAMFFTHASRERAMIHKLQQTSLLASACNSIWCDALNRAAEHDLKWFVLLHADIVPEAYFVDKLISLAEKHMADVMSAVVPIKDDLGITSTALSGPDHFTRLTRLTTKQVNHPSFPETFDASQAAEAVFKKLPEDLRIGKPTSTVYQRPILLVNTGCMVCRLDADWSSKAYFTINDRISIGPGGKLQASVEPEDWFFSRLVNELGGRVMATRAVRVEHLGGVPYRSDRVWGKNIDPATL